LIPLKLETLLSGRVVEQDRVEYKKGWNPNEVIRTVCAFANDYSNTNGGYIVLGIDQEKGRPVLPPVGVEKDELDAVQQDLFRCCNLIDPRYIPRTEIVEYQGKKLLYLWCAAGDAGPYSIPKDVLPAAKGKKKDPEGRQRDYWIKVNSIKTIAKRDELFELFDKFTSVPFDDRVNHGATIEDIRRAHVEDFLRESNSALAAQIDNMTMAEILTALEVANPTDVGVDIRNIGLLMFCEHPEKFIKYATTELVWFYSSLEEGSDDFTEMTFIGPIQKQIRDALHYIRISVITEKVVTHPDRAEADRFFTYPYDALEELLVNAQFHRLYHPCDPIQIRIYPNRIMICNAPGPDKKIDMAKFAQGKAIAVRYRNRRIGEFLQEIQLSEKKSTGITKVLNALCVNGSPAPLFETDQERESFFATIYLHEGFDPIIKENGGDGDRSGDRVAIEKRIQTVLEHIDSNGEINNAEARGLLGLSSTAVNNLFRGMASDGLVVAEGDKRYRVYRRPTE
jgi:ATP-dependent DNA helicase RecG